MLIFLLSLILSFRNIFDITFQCYFLEIFLTLFLIFFWLNSFLFPEIINRENKLSPKNKKTKSNWSKVPFDLLIVIIGRSVRFLFWSEFTMRSRYHSICIITNRFLIENFMSSSIIRVNLALCPTKICPP